MPPSTALPSHLRAPARRRARLLATWPMGIGLTSWRYMWRLTPLHRQEEPGDRSRDWAPALPEWLERDYLQDVDRGVGPLFHRRYVGDVREARLSAGQLIGLITADLDAVAPTELVSFDKVRGEEGAMRRNDEYVVRMPAPWDGPVRVVDVTPASFWLVTLEGHLEAGQIRFSAEDRGDRLRFSIESWARNADSLAELLYTHLRMAKEVQLHMWTSVIERVARMAGGRLTGGITVQTRRVDVA